MEQTDSPSSHARSAFRETVTRALGDRRGLLFLGALLFFVANSRGTIPFVDAQVRYMVAIQLWRSGSVTPTPEQWGETTITNVPDGKDGRPISVYGLGQSITMLPAVAAADIASRLLPAERRAEFSYLAGQLLYMTFVLPFLAALSLLAFQILLEKLRVEPAVATWSAFALGFATYWAFYTKTIGMELEMTGWILWALVIHWGEDRRPLRVALTGLLLGFTLLYRQEFLIPVALIVALFAHREWRRGRLSAGYLAILCVPIAAFGVVDLWHNFVRTGSIFNAGYSAVLRSLHMRVFADYPGEHLYDIMLGATRGFLWFSPIFFAALLLLLPGPRRWSRTMTLAAIPVATFTVFLASTWNADMVGGWGQRYMVPLVPFYLAGLTYALSPRLRRRSYRASLAALVAINAVFQGVLAFDDHNGVQTQIKLVQKMARDQGHPQMNGAQVNDMVGKFRNLGIAPFDDAWVARSWAAPEVAALRTGISDNLWWLKLGRKTSSAWASVLLAVLGSTLAVAGAWLLAAALFRGPRGREPEIKIRDLPAIPILMKSV
jgi:hypothetical protein